MGAFDDLIPQKGGAFADLVPQKPVKIGKDAFADALRDELRNADPFTRNLASAGTALSNMYEGVKQFVGGEGDKQRIQANRIMAEEAPIGAIAGNVAMLAPTVMIPGAATLRGAAAIGATQGALEPVLDGESRLKNAGTGALLGAGGVAAGRAVSGAYHGAKALVEPFTQKGRENIAARVMQKYTHDANAASARIGTSGSLVPGSAPTLAEASGDAGLAQLQRDIANMNPQAAAALYERGLDNNAARIAALRSIAGDDASMAAAKEARDSAANALYKQAFNSDEMRREIAKSAVDANRGMLGTGVAQISGDFSTPGLRELATRPAFSSAVAAAKKLSADMGEPLADPLSSLRGLHYIKLAIDEQLAGKSANSALSGHSEGALKSIKAKLLQEIESSDMAPLYGNARKTYSDMSRPINQMEIGQEIFNKATGSQLPNVRGDMTLFPSQFGHAIKNADAMAKRQFSGNSGLGDVLEPDQIRTLIAIRDDLARQAHAQNAGKAIGSNTAQNMAGSNILRQLLGPMGLPATFTESAFMQNLLRPVGMAYKGTEEPIQNALAQLVLNPSRAQAALNASGAATPNMEVLKYLLPVTTGVSAATQ